MERVGVVRLDWNFRWTGLQAPDMALLCKDKKEKKSRQGLCPWPLRCLSQFLSERKDRLLRGRMCLRTFHRWDGLVFLVYVFPNWMVTRILSHWTKYFLPLSVSEIRDIEGIVYLKLSFSLIGEIRLDMHDELFITNYLTFLPGEI